MIESDFPEYIISQIIYYEKNWNTKMISIIIPMYNSKKTIIQTLKGFEDQTNNDFEIIIVDDGSTDDSSGLITQYKDQSELIIKLLSQKNSGPAKARNLGVKHSQGEIIIFLDSDCIPPRNWVEKMVEPLNEKIVGCNCGYKVIKKESLIARYVDYEIAKRHEKLIGRNIDTIGTYSASFKKNIFEDIGGFDTKYSDASGEDFNFAFDIRKKGYDLFFTDKTFVYHHHPDSLSKFLKQQFWRGYWRVKMYLGNKDRIIKGDSYTGYEAQIQFILSGFLLISIPMIVFYPVITLLCFAILLLSNVPLGLWAFKREKKFLVIAPILASMRSLAGSIGVYKYIIENMLK